MTRAAAALKTRTGAAEADRTAERTAAKENEGDAAADTGRAAVMEVLLHSVRRLRGTANGMLTIKRDCKSY